MIIVNNLRKPGAIYDSSKLAILGNKISGSIRQKSKGAYTIAYTISGMTLNLKVMKFSPPKNDYAIARKDEQELLAGRISTYLNGAGISHKIQVR